MLKIQYHLIVFFQFIFSFSCLAQNWQWQNPLPQGNTLNDVCFLDSNRLIAVGEGGTVMQSDDKGENWQIEHYVENVHSDLTGVFFMNPDTGLSVGRDGIILRTVDSGSTWSIQQSNTTNDLRDIHFFDELTGIVVGNNATRLRTSDGGLTWESLASTQNGWNLFAVSILDSLNIIAVGNGPNIIRSEDGGESWIIVDSGTVSNLFAVFFHDSQNGIVVGELGKILLTCDGGKNWTDASITAEGFLQDISFQNPTDGIIVANTGLIYSTKDGGLSWDIKGEAESPLLAVAIDTNGLGLAAGWGGTIFKTEDAAESWKNISSGTTWRLLGFILSMQTKGLRLVPAAKSCIPQMPVKTG